MQGSELQKYFHEPLFIADIKATTKNDAIEELLNLFLVLTLLINFLFHFHQLNQHHLHIQFSIHELLLINLTHHNIMLLQFHYLQ